MSESGKNCVVTKNSNGHLDVTFRNPHALTPEFVPETAGELYSILSSADSDIWMNLSGIEFISSAAINMLLKIRHNGEEKGIRFGLSHLEPSVQDVLRVTQLDQLFETQPGCKPCV
jgi:anti-anti-sigma factor